MKKFKNYALFGVLAISILTNIIQFFWYSTIESQYRDEYRLLNTMHYTTGFHMIVAQESICYTIADEIDRGNIDSLSDFLRGASLPELHTYSVEFTKQPSEYSDDRLSALLERFWIVDGAIEKQISNLTEEQVSELSENCSELSKLLCNATKASDCLMDFFRTREFESVEYYDLVDTINQKLDDIEWNLLETD